MHQTSNEGQCCQ